MAKIMLVIPPSSGGNIVSDYMAGLGMRMKGAESSLPPLNLLYYASMLRQENNEVDLIDAAAEKLNLSQVLQRINKFGPQKTFVEIRYPSFINDLVVAEKIKDICSSVFALGPMASFFSTQIMERYHIDGVEEDVVNKISLQNLSFPARDLIDRKLYFFRTLPRNPLATIITSQGCPYGCIYCPYYIIQGSKIRMRSIDNVLKELTMLYQEGYRSILFRDPIFTFDHQRVKEICSGIIKNRLKFDWWVETRTDNLDYSLLKIMSDAGVKGINFGVESGNDEVARNAGRRANEKAKTKEIIDICRKLKIKTKAFFILGLPGETLNTLNQTMSTAIEINPDYAVFMIATPFPGTKLMDIFIKEKNLNIFFEKDEIYFIPPGLSLDDLKKARRIAVKRFYLRLGPILRELRLLCSVQGVKEFFSYIRWLLIENHL